MSFYTEIKPFISYLHQIRKLENYVVFEMLFHKNWKIPKKFIVEDKFLNNGSLDDKLYLSFICDFEENSLNIIQSNILGIIKYNLEREAKERLFEDKVNELKSMFDKESLENLRVLQFEFNKNIITNDEEQQGNGKAIGFSELIEE